MVDSSSRITGARRTIVVSAVLGALVVIGFLPVFAPAPASGPNSIAVDRARAHVAEIATRPHAMGSPEITDVRAVVADLLVGAGLEPERQVVRAPDFFFVPGREVEVVNLMARIPGTGSGDAIVLMAHYDTVPETPGANDDAAAVAALIEVARVLTGSAPMRNDVILLLTDGEEPNPRFGASAFVDHPWFRDVRVAFDFEAIGRSGPSMLVQANGPTGPLVSALADGVDDPVAFSFMSATADLIGGAATDFDVMKANDVPGMVFAYLGGSSVYHTAGDSIERLNDAGMAHHGAIALGLVRHFGDLDLASIRTGGEVAFYTLPGHLLVAHPEGWSWPLIVLGMLLTAGSVWVDRHAGRIRTSVAATARVGGGAGVAAVAIALVWWGIVTARPTMGRTESYAYLAVIGALVVGGWLIVSRLGRYPADALRVGAVATWGLFAAGLTLLAPGLGAGFVWVFLAGSAGLAIVSDSPDGSFRRWVAFIVVSVTTLVLVLPMVDTFFQVASPRPGNPDSQLPAVAAVVGLALFAACALVGTSLPWRGVRPSPTRRPGSTDRFARPHPIE